MRCRPIALALLTALAGCSTATEEVSQTPQAPAAPSSSADVAVSSGGLHDAVAKVAVTAKTVEEFEFRLDAQGALVKQAVYHDDASAISEAVKAKAEEMFPGGKIAHFETEWYAGIGDVHEVEVMTADGRECEVAALPDGTVRYEECKLDPAKLPAPVAAAVEAAYPGGKILEAETKKGPDLDVITVEVETGGTEYYLQLAQDGTLQSIHKRVEALVEIPVELP